MTHRTYVILLIQQPKDKLTRTRLTFPLDFEIFFERSLPDDTPMTATATVDNIFQIYKLYSTGDNTGQLLNTADL
jgi:hypothetical protein